jgi:hypothetical protein
MATLWEKLQFWKKQKPKYKFQYREGDTTWVEITSGAYTGVIFSYGMVKFVPETIVAKLEFTYNILHPGKHDIDLLQNDEKFVTIMGDILTQILMNKAKADEQIRTGNSEEFDLQ